MRNHDADSTVIQHREDAVGVRSCDPNQPGCAEGTSAQEADLERLARPGRMLFVQHDEVVADRAEYLGGVRGWRLAESPNQELATE